MTYDDIETGTITIEDVCSPDEPIVLHHWLLRPRAPEQPRTTSIAWLRANEPELVAHIEWMLSVIDDMEIGQYEQLANGRKKDDWGFYPRSLWDHACSHTVTDIGCYELAEWAAKLCLYEYGRRIAAAERAAGRDGSMSALDEDVAHGWQQLVAAEPCLGEIEARARQFGVPPRLRGTFAGEHAGWPTYRELCREANRLIGDLYDLPGGLEGLARGRSIAGVVIAHAMYRCDP